MMTKIFIFGAYTLVRTIFLTVFDDGSRNRNGAPVLSDSRLAVLNVSEVNATHNKLLSMEVSDKAFTAPMRWLALNVKAEQAFLVEVTRQSKSDEAKSWKIQHGNT